MRKTRKISQKTEEVFSLEVATGKIKELENAVSVLQKRVAELEEETGIGEYGLPESFRQKPPKLGRKRRVEVEDLLRRRNALVCAFEQNWPDLCIPIRKATCGADVVEALRRSESFCNYPFTPDFARHPEKYATEVWAFLQSGRYRDNPRNLANAMAGLPHISWKRSWDICSSNPDKAPPLLQAYREYLRRKFPDRLHALLGATSTEEVRAILRRSRSKDPVLLHLRENPDKVLDWLEQGKPKPR